MSLRKILFAGYLAVSSSGFSQVGPGSEAPPTASVKVRAVLEAETAVPVAGFWVARRVDKDQPPLRFALLPQSATTEISLPAPATWEVALEAEGFWAPRQVVRLEAVGNEVEPLEISVWPLGRIRGTLKTPGPSDRLPEWFEAEIPAPRQGEAPKRPKGRTGCKVEPQEASRTVLFDCALPAGQYDLSFHTADYAPFYASRVSVSPSTPAELGVQPLKRGGSLVGWAVLEGGKILSSKGRVDLFPFVATGGDAPLRRELEGRNNSQSLSLDGSFRWSGLAPGIYRLVVEHEGYAPLTVGPLEVQAGRETLLREPLVLRRPLDLALTLTPGVDGFGRPWRVELLARAVAGREASQAPAFEGATDREGRILAHNLTPGIYGLTISDSFGNPFHTDPNYVVEGVGRVEGAVALEIWTLAGSIRLGGEPVATAIYFGGRRGAESVRFDSDIDGRFHGVLPRVGLWRVEIGLKDNGEHSVLAQQVRVRPTNEQEAEVEISIPDTHLSGRVIEADGKAAAGADVFVEAQEANIQLATDSAGKFSVRGLPEGKAVVGASAGRGESQRTSAPQEVTLKTRTAQRDEGALTDLELILEKGTPWKGRVDSANGPVVGAKVFVFPTSPDQGAGATTRTDAAGQFRVSMSPRARTAYAVLAAPGYGLTVVSWNREGGPLAVSPEQGSLEIVSPTPWNALDASQRIEIFQDGRPLPMASLLGWMQVFGQIPSSKTTSRTFPGLKPGHYALCLGPALNSLFVSTPEWATTRARCAEGSLPQGGTLSLTLPRAQS